MKLSISKLTIIIWFFLILVNGRDCYLSCDQVQVTYDKQICYQNCDMKLIIGATVGSACGLFMIICIICCCRYRTNTCMYFIKSRLKKRLNIVDPGSCTPLQFQQQANDFIKAIKKSETISNFYFQFKNKKETMVVDSESFTSNQEEDYLLHFSFKGKDEFSSFIAEGYFLYRDGSPFVWFYKRYDPYDLAIQLGLKEIIIFETLNNSIQAWTGCWYDQEGQQDENIKGKWILIMRIIGITNRLEEITPSTQLY